MKIILSLLFLFVYSCATKKKDYFHAPLPGTPELAVSAPWRSEVNRQRDKYQHPIETLNFFGIRPWMRVVEVSPGVGYYTEILAPYLADKGQLFLAVPRLPPRPPRVLLENEKKLQDILLRHQEVQNKTKLIPFEPIEKRTMHLLGSADLVVSFNSVHNWVAKNEAEKSFKLFYDLLKPGGALGIVQHRVSEGKIRVPKSGYMYESEVIELATQAGFKFLEKSEINANPKDSADYPEGVWVLPPIYRSGRYEKSYYQRIGESDRMTLKFLRPKDTPKTNH
jgi:predicted methyltransferase